MSDQLNEFIQAQHGINLTVAGSLGRIEQALKDQNTRMFGEPGQVGALPYIVDQIKTNAAEAKKSCDEIEVRTEKLEVFKTGAVKWVAGAVAVLMLEGSALAFYFTHLAGAVKIGH